jgi:hypothetical protein
MLSYIAKIPVMRSKPRWLSISISVIYVDVEYNKK